MFVLQIIVVPKRFSLMVPLSILNHSLSLLMMIENVLQKKKKMKKKDFNYIFVNMILDSKIEHELCIQSLRTIHVMWRYGLATQLFLDFFPLFR